MMGKKSIGILVGLWFPALVFSQPARDPVDRSEIETVIRILASDSLRGRGNGSLDLLKASTFIGDYFAKAGLLPYSGMPGYHIPFRISNKKKSRMPATLLWNGQPVSPDRFIYIHQKPGLFENKSIANFSIRKLDSCFVSDMLIKQGMDTTPLLLWTDIMQPGNKDIFPGLIDMPPGGMKRDVLLVYASASPGSLSLTGNPAYYASVLYNVVGILPGRSKPDEVIVFSAHYDHEGVYRKLRPDSIMNGANDNASGTTALIALAKYFAVKADNERTILFCAFAGEELGLLGSSQFISQLNPRKIVAVINIEMIGVSQFGENKVFVTGEDYSTLPSILKRQLKATGIDVIAEPPEEKMLFRRSDNFPFAAKGVPAHTIMSSSDDDGCYHLPCDEISRINIPHLTNVIRGIATGTASLISGEETPSRVRHIEITR